MLSHQVLQMLQSRPETQPIVHVRLYGDGTDSVIAVELTRVGKLTHVDQIAQRNQLPAALRTHVNVLYAADGALGVSLPFQHNFVFFAVFNIGGHTARAQHGFQSLAYIAHAHAEIGRGGTINQDFQLWARFFVVPIQRGKTWVILLYFLQQNIPPDGQFLIGAATEHKLDRLLGALAKPLAHDRNRLNTRQTVHGLTHALSNVH